MIVIVKSNQDFWENGLLGAAFRRYTQAADEY